MPKFYVESGPLSDVVDAPDSLSACIKAIKRSLKKIKSGEKSIKTANIFTVNEKGFLTDRDQFTTSDFVQHDAREVLKELKG
tara:strand:- start:102369 stop:102614 length:246 start_codon:yes stop_codon:yes gene_type:complete